MAKRENKSAVARQVELIIRRMGSLSTLPEVAVMYLGQLAGNGFDAGALEEIIESDPALTARILALAHEKAVAFTDDVPSVAEAVAKLPAALIRDAVLSVKVFQAFDADFDPDSRRTLPRKELAMHALAVACCAQQIGEIALPARERQMAFSAGLLHDIGKIAIDQVMPKSFSRIVDQAKSQLSPIHVVEKEHLGLDHTIIGKRLAEQWSLPVEISYAIWLHHTDAEIISENVPAAKMALVVQLADIIARQSGIGLSGSFDTPESIEAICRGLSLSSDQVETIRGGLAEAVGRRSQLLGLQQPGGQAASCELIFETAARLAKEHTDLSTSHTQTTIASAQMEFVGDFLPAVEGNEAAIDVACKFVAEWQKHYQTGPACVYVVEDSNEAFVEMATVDKTGRTDTVLVNVPSGVPAIPEVLQKEFVIVDAADHVGWVFERTDFEMDLSVAKVLPLPACGKTAAVLIFEPRTPFDPAGRPELFAAVASVAGSVIELALTNLRHNRLAERFAELLGSLKTTRGELTEAKSLAGIAEMAAGAAHELNNPLSVISGRAQLLQDSEADADKKQMLKQIQSRTREISQIVADLMSFARPAEPSAEVVGLRALIDQAVANTTKAHGLAAMEVEIAGIDESVDVCVDRGQIVRAIANILSNSLEAYKGGSGLVQIDTACAQSEGAVTFRIIDFGCGMDGETIAKACRPFFSAKPAGRKRGMGLAHSLRLLELNKGTLSIAG
ncbi:MAG: HDOD domain-containing protein, partial [Planctomycetes bacterium]|nr:HDOD domain-containing protein [Planctomycetota bacterium]